jgi:F-type H+-transporting ATPase subunit a
VFSLFTFILVSNVIGIAPYTFTVASHIIVTAALALLVFFTVLIYGLYRNGLKFLRIFVPSGIPIYILPLAVVIEIISFLTRPLSHSVRLFANMWPAILRSRCSPDSLRCSAPRLARLVGSAAYYRSG